MAMTLTFATKGPREDRVRARTNPEINQRIDNDLERRLRYYAAQDEDAISERIEELDREWDIERVLEANAASLGLMGVLFGATLSRKWFLLPLMVSGFLFQHAVQGWCPPAALFRNLGIRTRMEIEQERYALKILRGDFDDLEREEAGGISDTDQLAEALRS